MSPKAFAALFIITAVALAAAGFGIAQDRGFRAAEGVGEKVFPKLLDRVNDTASMVIDHAGGRITLRRGAGGWTFKEKLDYPAREVKIKRAVLGLAELKLANRRPRRRKNSPSWNSATPAATGRNPAWRRFTTRTARCWPRSSSASAGAPCPAR